MRNVRPVGSGAGLKGRRWVAALLLAPALLLAAALSAACDDEGDVDDSQNQAATEPSAVAGAVTPAATTSAAGATGTAQAGGAAQTSGPVADPALRTTTITGLNQPTQMAFLAADDLLVTQKGGEVVRVQGGQVVGPVLQLATNFADERGVLGITLHPQFAQNRWVYIYWTWTGEGGVPNGLTGNPSEDIEQVPALGNRIDRFTWDGSRLTFDRNVIELPSLTTDLTGDRRRGNHDGGVIKFGPDGKLYAVIGDQNARGRLQNVPDGPEQTGPEALLGVVLRLNDDGSIPTDNPFVSLGDDRAKTFVYGVRNSFGFDFDPQSGQFWLEVNGQAAYDYIGRYEAGDNAGWIQFMGPPERLQDYKAIEVDTERKLDSPDYPPERLANTPEEARSRLTLLPGARYREPQFSWRYVVAPAGLGFIRGDALGPDYAGDMLLGDVNTGSIWRFKPSADRLSLQLTGPLADRVNDNTQNDRIGELRGTLFASGIPIVTDIKSAPDGSVWISSMALGTLYRISR